MRAGSLFSGYGGLSLTVEQAFGATTAWVADVEPAACRVLERRFPGVPNLGDVTTVDWAAVEPVDIIEGGSPCQDISAAGKRAGMTDGTRSNLWVAMREAIAVIKPTYVIWENVAGALSAVASSASDPNPDTRFAHYEWTDDDEPTASGDMEQRTRPVGNAAPKPALRAAGRVLGDLTQLGYDTEWRTVRASDVGACHQRRRVFILAWRRDAAHGQGVQQREPIKRMGQRAELGRGAGLGLTLPTPTSNLGDNGGPQHPDKRRAGGHSVSIEDAIHALTTLPTPSVTDMGRDKTPDEWTAAMKERHGNGNGHGPSLHVEARRASLPTPDAQAFNGGRMQSHAALDLGNRQLHVNDIPRMMERPDWGQYAAAIARHEAAFGRPAPEPTIPTRRGGRKLSGAFCEWMMGLPAGWIWELVLDGTITNNDALRLCGNGVVTQQAAYALSLMIPHIPARSAAA